MSSFLVSMKRVQGDITDGVQCHFERKKQDFI